jgi:hypothetical protein
MITADHIEQVTAILKAVVEEMGDGHTQIMNILKRKRKILDDFENNVPSSRKRQRTKKIKKLHVIVFLFLVYIYC